MPRNRTLEERLLGAAVLKVSFQLSARDQTPEFRALFPGILQDLRVTEEDVDAFIAAHRGEVEARARQAAGKHVTDN